MTFEYSHRNPSNLLADIERLTFNPSAIGAVPSEHVSLLPIGDTILFNTWYAQQRFKHMNQYGITIDTLYSAFDENCRNAFGISVQDLSDDLKKFFPTIDYPKFEIAHAQKWIGENSGKKILVENGNADSGQAHNFDMTSIVSEIAKKHMDKIFIFTSHSNIRLPDNCIYSDGIIKKPARSDLNEISYLSTHCDMLIGRASGVWSFCLTQQNLFERNMRYLCFSNLVPAREGKFWMGELFQDKLDYSSRIITTNESDTNKISKLIEENL